MDCKFQVGCPKIRNAKLQKYHKNLNPPIESKLSRDSIGGFKSCDILQFCIPSLDGASNLKNTVYSLWSNAIFDKNVTD